MRARTVPPPVATIAWIVLCLAFVLAAPAPARAGEYVVVGCAGQAASVAGWTPTTTGTGNTPSSADACPAGQSFAGVLTAPPSVPAAQAARAEWSVTAPASTTIARLVPARTVTVRDGDGYQVTAQQGGGQSQPLESCTGKASCDALSATVQPGLTAPAGTIKVTIAVSCPAGGPADCPAAGAAQFGVSRTELTLSDAAGPHVDAPSGPLLATAGVGPGAQALSVHATDAGGGLRTFDLQIDGAVAASWPAGASCSPPFLVLVPCPLEVGQTVSFDPAALSAGPHVARIVARDVAGNAGTSPPVTIVRSGASGGGGGGGGSSASGSAGVGAAGGGSGGASTSVPGSPTSQPAVRAVLTAELRTRHGGRRSLVLDHGERAVVVGTLRGAGGEALAGARILVAGRLLGRAVSDRVAPIATALTRADGSFRVGIAPGPSRSLQLSYRVPGQDAPAAQVSVALRVRAGVTMRAPRRAARGVTIVLRGRVDDASRAFVELQARNGRRWQTFATTTTDARGRYALRYAFRPGGPSARYALRARVPAQPGLPYLSGTSAARWIRVR